MSCSPVVQVIADQQDHEVNPAGPQHHRADMQPHKIPCHVLKRCQDKEIGHWLNLAPTAAWAAIDAIATCQALMK